MRVREKRPARGDIIDVPLRELRQFDPHEYPDADDHAAEGRRVV